jgi:hypothetical protein
MISQFSLTKDWICLEEELNYKAVAVSILNLMENYLPCVCLSQPATSLLGRLEARREKREVYMLTSFIEAHEHAQKKIHGFLGLEEETIDEPSPEELQVIQESKAAVNFKIYYIIIIIIIIYYIVI